MKHILFLLTLLFTVQIFPEGFAADTKVKTEHGYKPIEHIFKGRAVICRSLKKYKSKTDTVFHTYKTRLQEFACLEFRHHTFKCALDQQFYIRATREWVTAQQIVCNKYIQNLFTQQTKLLSAKVIQEPIDVYIFTTKKYHNFLVSFDDILVHNLEPLFATTAGLMYASLPVIGESAGTMLTSGNPYLAALGLVAASGYFIYNLVTSNSRQKEAARELQNLLDEQRQKQLEKECKESIAATGSPGPQKDPDNKRPEDKDKNKKSHPHGKYEDAGYHHPNSKGRKNPCPIDGQKALDNSIEVKGSNQRIAVEDDCFVILRRTKDNLYHGHVRTWKELTHKMQNTLENANMVTRKGKILK